MGCLIGMSEFINVGMNDESRGIVFKGPNNVPHKSPTWRKRMHKRLGQFQPQTNANCWDYHFWLKALHKGAKFFHINKPLETTAMLYSDITMGSTLESVCIQPHEWNTWKAHLLTHKS